MMFRKVAILGSETYPFPQEVETVVYNVFLQNPNLIFFSRGLKGIDLYAEDVINYLNDSGKDIKKVICDSDNEVIQQCDIVIIFWNGYCKRTKQLLDLALKYHKEVAMHIRRIQ